MTTTTPTRPRRRFRRPKLATTTINRREDINHDLWKIWIDKPEGFTFKAGQYCTIGVNGIERAYSIVSAPYEEDLELFVELVPPPDGNLTPLLHEIGEGATVTIRPRAKGIFVFDPTLPNQLLVATVTGVVPYLSILRQYVRDGATGHRFYVLMGASYVDEFGYDDEVGEVRVRLPRPSELRSPPSAAPTGEAPNAAWTGETGRVNNIVEKYVEKWNLTARRHVHLRLRPPGHDRRRQGQHDTPRLRRQGRTLLEGRRLAVERVHLSLQQLHYRNNDGCHRRQPAELDADHPPDQPSFQFG